jgi:hypothetical protein
VRSRSGEVLNRYKDVQSCSRIMSHIACQQQAPRLRHVINELAKQHLPDFHCGNNVSPARCYNEVKISQTLFASRHLLDRDHRSESFTPL